MGNDNDDSNDNYDNDPNDDNDDNDDSDDNDTVTPTYTVVWQSVPAEVGLVQSSSVGQEPLMVIL